MAFQPKQIYSIEEYLELEKKSEEKLEFWDGNVWSMSEATAAHDRVITNLIIDIGSRIRTSGCDVYSSDMRVKVPSYFPYRYPDLTALCGKPDIEQIGGIDILVNPQLIVEVLSRNKVRTVIVRISHRGRHFLLFRVIRVLVIKRFRKVPRKTRNEIRTRGTLEPTALQSVLRA